MTRRFASRLTLLLVLCSCSCRTSTSDAPPQQAAKPAVQEDRSPEDEGAAVEGDPDQAAREVPAAPADGVDDLPTYEGKAGDELLARLGEPSSRRSFTMSECCSEFEIEIDNTYPPDADHGAVEIHEWTWAYEGYALTIWLHAPEAGGPWVSLDSCLYSDEVEF